MGIGEMGTRRRQVEGQLNHTYIRNSNTIADILLGNYSQRGDESATVAIVFTPSKCGC
jgi:hypothetical protein